MENKNKAKRVPKLRFKGFTDDWEQRKLKETSKISTGKAFSSKSYSKNGKYRVITNKNINQKNQVTDFINTVDPKIINKYRLAGNNILVTMDGVKIGTISYFNDPNALLAQRVGRVKTINRNNFDFILELLCRSNFKKEMQRKSVGNAIKHISLNDIGNFKIGISSKELENKKIGKLLRCLDKIIFLQQRKISALNKIKTALLQIIFSKTSTKNWSNTVLGKIVNIHRGLTYHPNNIVQHDGIRVLRSSNISDSEIVYNSDDVFVDKSFEKESTTLKTNDILITAANGSSKLVGKHAIITHSNNDQAGGFMLFIRTKQPNFINAYLDSDWFKNVINKNTTGGNGAIGNLKQKDLLKENIRIPSVDLREKIGSLFRSVNQKIDYEKVEMDYLNQIKKFLLQNMFI